MNDLILYAYVVVCTVLELSMAALYHKIKEENNTSRDIEQFKGTERSEVEDGNDKRVHRGI